MPSTTPTAADLRLGGAWHDKLEACRNLRDGWNGYTAPAPSSSAVDNAGLILEAMLAADSEPTRLGPSAMGGVAITRSAGERKVLVECYNDGRAFALFSCGPDEDDMSVEPLRLDPDGLEAHVLRTGEYLHG